MVEGGDGGSSWGRLAESPGCDHCGGASAAVLYCRADTARLCIACDAEVHAANALARKHTRAPICDNCTAAPAAVFCTADGLTLCGDCDADAHGTVGPRSSHPRTPVESISGCPSASELAAAWGFDVAPGAKVPPFGPPEQFIGDEEWFSVESSLTAVDPVFKELYVPCAKRQKSSPPWPCGKGRQELWRQLVDLIGRDSSAGAASAPCQLRPRTPNRNNRCREEEEVGSIVEAPLPMWFPSLLLEGTSAAALKENDRLVEDDLIWDRGPSDHAAQVSESSLLSFPSLLFNGWCF